MEDPEIVFESGEDPEIVFESDELCHPADLDPLFLVSLEKIKHRTLRVEYVFTYSQGGPRLNIISYSAGGEKKIEYRYSCRRNK